MNRRDFFKRVLGVIGLGVLAGSIEPTEETTVLTRIDPIVGRDDIPFIRSPYTYELRLPDHTHDIRVDVAHTHDIAPYPSTYTIFNLEELG